jgi:hypothetical protein
VSKMCILLADIEIVFLLKQVNLFDLADLFLHKWS